MKVCKVKKLISCHTPAIPRFTETKTLVKGYLGEYPNRLPGTFPKRRTLSRSGRRRLPLPLTKTVFGASIAISFMVSGNLPREKGASPGSLANSVGPTRDPAFRLGARVLSQSGDSSPNPGPNEFFWLGEIFPKTGPNLPNPAALGIGGFFRSLWKFRWNSSEIQGQENVFGGCPGLWLPRFLGMVAGKG